MKRLILATLLPLLALASANAQNVVSSSAANLKKEAVLKLNQHEVLYDDEYSFALAASGDRYCCVVRDTLSWNYTIIWNGKRIVTADYVKLYYFDLFNLDNCVYAWANRSKDDNRWNVCIKTGEGAFGPYSSIGYVPSLLSWSASPFLPSWQYKDCFVFSNRNDYVFLRINGSSIPISDEGDWDILECMDNSPLSPNGKHWAEFNDNILTFDGKEYSFTLPADSSDQQATPLNCGLAYIKYFYNDDWYCFIFNPANGELTRINRNGVYFDFRTEKIVTDVEEPSHVFYEGAAEALLEGFPYTVYDTTGKYEMILDYRNEFVLIDGIAYGNETPINACYDKANNAFVWISYKDGTIYRYSYKLK